MEELRMMRFSSLFLFAGLASVYGQNISFTGPLCQFTGLTTSITFAKHLYIYKTYFVDKLNTLKTLKAQKALAKTFITDKWEALGHNDKPTAVKKFIPQAQAWLEARWREVTYLKTVLSKLKTKLKADIFTQVRDKLWALDTSSGNQFGTFYPAWIAEVDGTIITNAAVKKSFNTVIANNKAAFDKSNPGKWDADAAKMVLNGKCFGTTPFG